MLRTRARMQCQHRLGAPPAGRERAGRGQRPRRARDLRSSIFYPLVTGRANGTGLGLAVAQELVTRNGGIIEFESEPGRTVFTLLLPLGEDIMNGEQCACGSSTTTPPSAGCSSGRCSNGGMSARAFDAAEPALDALRRESPDVLITDIRMPGASGLELLKRIRDTRPALPVIVMTAHSDLGSAVSAYEGGAFEYLPKPFDIDQAVALVRRAANAGMQASGEAGGTPRIPELLGRAPAMQQVFRAIGRLARSSMSPYSSPANPAPARSSWRARCTITARAHAKPFIALNTSAIPG